MSNRARDKTVSENAEGFVWIPSGPGLGAEVNEATVRELAKAVYPWRNSVWRHDDGSAAEWGEAGSGPQV